MTMRSFFPSCLVLLVCCVLCVQCENITWSLYSGQDCSPNQVTSNGTATYQALEIEPGAYAYATDRIFVNDQRLGIFYVQVTCYSTGNFTFGGCGDRQCTNVTAALGGSKQVRCTTDNDNLVPMSLVVECPPASNSAITHMHLNSLYIIMIALFIVLVS